MPAPTIRGAQYAGTWSTRINTMHRPMNETMSPATTGLCVVNLPAHRRQTAPCREIYDACSMIDQHRVCGTCH